MSSSSNPHERKPLLGWRRSTRKNVSEEDPLIPKSKADESGVAAPGRMPSDVDGKVDVDGKSSPKPKKEKPKRVSIIGLFRFASCFDVFIMIIGALAAMLSGLSRPLIFLFFGNMISAFIQFQQDLILPKPFMNKMEYYALAYVVIGVSMAVAGYLESGCWQLTGERQTRRLREKYFSSLLRQEIAWFDKSSTGTGALVSRVSSDSQTVQEAIGDKFGCFIRLLIGFIGSFGLAFFRSWRMTVVMLGIVPFLIVAGIIIGKAIVTLATRGQAAYAEAGTVAQEVLSSVRTVVAFSGEARASAKYAEKLAGAQKVGETQARVSGFGMGVTMFTLFGSYALGFWYGARLITEGHIDGGHAVTVFFTIVTGAFQLGQLSPYFEAISNGRGAAYKMWEAIDRKSRIDPFDESGMTISNVRGEIFFENVHFQYETRAESPVLRGVTFSVRQGQTVALVGTSGCGKSTIVSLLQRFYDPTDGDILLDGTSTRSLNLKWFRRQIGFVSQEPVLFGTSIKENILYGNPEAGMREVEEAARLANAHDFIMTLPLGYDTLVGERGAQLSGGQKQRVAIARALIRNPRVLVFDEATSALDSESEKIVQAALEKASAGRTTIVIAHRLSTVRNADCIVVMRQGQVVETGRHDDLMAIEHGVYRALVEAQESRRSQYHQHAQVDSITSVPSVISIPDESLTRSVSLNPEDDQFDAEFENAQTEGSPLIRPSASEPIAAKNGKRDAVAVSLGGGTPNVDPKASKKPLKAVRLSRLVGLHRPEFGFLFLGFLGSVGAGLAYPMFSILFSQMLQTFAETGPKQTSDARFWSLCFLAQASGVGLSYVFQSWMFGLASERFTRRLRTLSFDRMLRQEIGFFDDKANSSGVLATRLSTEASQVKGMLGLRLGLITQILVTVAASTIISFISGWKLTIVAIACAPFVAASGILYMKLLSGKSMLAKKAYESSGETATTALENIRTVCSFGLEERLINEYHHALDIPFEIGVKRSHFAAFGTAFSNFCIFGTYAVVFYYGAYLVSNFEMDYLHMFRVFSAIVYSAVATGQMTSFAPDFAKAQLAANQIFQIIDRQSAIDVNDPTGERPDGISGSITFRDIKFRYPSRRDVEVLRGLNFQVEAGKTLALVGASGSGKSTVIALLERFYDTSEGEILFDNHPIRSLNLSWLRSQIALVSQEPILFAASIAENIAYGKEGATQMEIEAAARMANIHDFIASLPKGYDTLAGEKGTQLSGGQKQRIAIARALIRNPRVLLLDEATSALDSESEKVVQDALEKASKGRTTIVIAHRLSTVKDADCIAVMNKGVIVEYGRHDELIAARGEYSRLVRLQQRTLNDM